MKNLLLVEDEPEFHAILQACAEEACPGVVLQKIRTEVEFLDWLKSEDVPAPDLILLDIKIPVTSPSPSMRFLDVPDTNGGLRCFQRLRESPRHSHIPAYLISSTPPEDLPCISKADTEKLCSTMREHLRRE